jgi:hypothetical protein
MLAWYQDLPYSKSRRKDFHPATFQEGGSFYEPVRFRDGMAMDQVIDHGSPVWELTMKFFS